MLCVIELYAGVQELLSGAYFNKAAQSNFSGNTVLFQIPLVEVTPTSPRGDRTIYRIMGRRPVTLHRISGKFFVVKHKVDVLSVSIDSDIRPCTVEIPAIFSACPLVPVLFLSEKWYCILEKLAHNILRQFRRFGLYTASLLAHMFPYVFLC
jgi:hypothetical protein